MRKLMVSSLIGMMLSLPMVAVAEDDTRSEPNVRTERVPAMRERAYKQLSKARELMDAERMDEALERLSDLRDGRSSNAYEKAMAWNLTAYIAYEKGDEKGAIKAYQQVLAQSAIPASLRQHTLYALAQMYMSTSQWKAAVGTLEDWFKIADEPTTDAYLLLGSAYYQLEDYTRALRPIEKAVADARAKGQVPKENALLLLRSIYYSQNDYKKMADVLKTLCQNYSKREYWIQLAAAYGETDRQSKQLAAMMAAHDLGLFSAESDYLALSQLLMAADVPFRAAQILQEGMDKSVVERNLRSLRQLADAWVLAKDYDQAIEALQAASKAGGDAQLTLRLAQMLYEEGRYSDAVAAADRALGKGGAADQDQVYVIKGLALYELERFGDARTAFGQAAKYEGSRQVAQQWLAYLQKEQERRDALREIREAASAGRRVASSS